LNPSKTAYEAADLTARHTCDKTRHAYIHGADPLPFKIA